MASKQTIASRLASLIPPNYRTEELVRAVEIIFLVGGCTNCGRRIDPSDAITLRINKLLINLDCPSDEHITILCPNCSLDLEVDTEDKT